MVSVASRPHLSVPSFQNADAGSAFYRESSELLSGLDGSSKEFCELLWRGALQTSVPAASLCLDTHQPLTLLSPATEHLWSSCSPCI